MTWSKLTQCVKRLDPIFRKCMHDFMKIPSHPISISPHPCISPHKTYMNAETYTLSSLQKEETRRKPIRNHMVRAAQLQTNLNFFLNITQPHLLQILQQLIHRNLNRTILTASFTLDLHSIRPSSFRSLSSLVQIQPLS